MTKPTCADVAEQDLVERYVTGRLDPEAAEALEAHYFGCDACWERVREAAEVRAAFSDRAGPAVRDVSQRGAPGRSFPSRWKVLVPLAAAAGVGALLFATGVWNSGTEPPTGVVRGSGETLSVETRTESGGLRISWSAVEGADTYELRVFSEAGDLLGEERTGDAELLVAADDVAAWVGRAGQGNDVYMRIVARDSARRVLAESPLVPIPTDTQRPPSG